MILPSGLLFLAVLGSTWAARQNDNAAWTLSTSCHKENHSKALRTFETCLKTYHGNKTPVAKSGRTFGRKDKNTLIWTTCPTSQLFRDLLGLETQLADDKASPWAVVLPANADDVAAAVRCASTARLEFSVLGGGHSYIAASLVNKGVVINMQVCQSKY